ncbi:MAG: hypothetical protein ABIN58_12055, partial [candidate division WOR-3 bacterium]
APARFISSAISCRNSAGAKTSQSGPLPYVLNAFRHQREFHFGKSMHQALAVLVLRFIRVI